MKSRERRSAGTKEKAPRNPPARRLLFRCVGRCGRRRLLPIAVPTDRAQRHEVLVAAEVDVVDRAVEVVEEVDDLRLVVRIAEVDVLVGLVLDGRGGVAGETGDRDRGGGED